MMKILGVLMLMLLLGCGHAAAENLLSNGSFDSNIDGWNNPFVTAAWVADDGAPISGNGSMQVTGVQNNNSLFGMNSFHIFVQPNYWYLAAASFKTPAASVSERGVFYIEWYDDEDMFIRRDSIDGGYGVDDDVWIPLDGFLQAPDNARYMVMRLMLQSGIPGVDVDLPYGLWDDAVFMQETIFRNGFN